MSIVRLISSRVFLSVTPGNVVYHHGTGAMGELFHCNQNIGLERFRRHDGRRRVHNLVGE
jgi:hypothetical protein